ncbi:MAG: DUF481 domain-containing protein [Kiritimatiellae bacterium]|nr:DUF481 domain-containing protein [Kiritimatiellia bacterium]
MKIRYLAAVAMAACFASAAFADKVVFSSGAFLTGTAGEFSNGKLNFKSEELGEIAIDVEKIAKLESDGVHTVRLHDMTTSKAKVTVVDGDYMVEENGELKPLDMEDVKDIDPVVEKWHGSANLAATATRGNTIGESVSFEADVRRRWEKDRFTASTGYYFSQSGDSRETKRKDTSRYELMAQEDHFWTGEKFYSYVKGKYEFDRIMELNYRYRLGAGLGYQWLEKDDFGHGPLSFSQELGAEWIEERYKPIAKDDYCALRYAHHFAWGITAVDGMDFTHNFEYLPQVDDWENYLINADVALVYAFRPDWQLKLAAEWNYHSRVADGIKRSDIRYILALGYKW